MKFFADWYSSLFVVILATTSSIGAPLASANLSKNCERSCCVDFDTSLTSPCTLPSEIHFSGVMLCSPRSSLRATILYATSLGRGSEQKVVQTKPKMVCNSPVLL